MRNVTVILAVLAVVALLAVPAYGARVNSKAGTYDWHATPTPTNWFDYNTGLDHAPPGAGDLVEIRNNATPIINNPVTVNYIEVGKYGLGNLEINADLTCTDTNAFGVGVQSGDSGTCLVTHNSGTVSLVYHLTIGENWNANKVSYAKYTINGGAISISSYRYLIVGNCTGTNSHSYGTFEVDGDGADSIAAGYYAQNADSTLALILDGDADPIQQIDIANNVTLAGSLVITGSSGATGPVTIMTYGGTLTGTFDSVTTGWTVDYGVTTPGVITVIPEPATMTLLGLGGLGVLIRRRRK